MAGECYWPRNVCNWGVGVSGVEATRSLPDSQIVS
jgi:hypothetical protein